MEQQFEITVGDLLLMAQTYEENGWLEDSHAILDWLYTNGHIDAGLLWAYKTEGMTQ